MSDEDYEALKSRISAVWDYWEPRLGLRWWRMACTFSRDGSRFAIDTGHEASTAACCSADWRYLHAEITFNMVIVANLDDEELEQLVVHEMTHALVNEMRQGNDEGLMPHEERVVSTIAKAFIWTRDMTRDEVAA